MKYFRFVFVVVPVVVLVLLVSTESDAVSDSGDAVPLYPDWSDTSGFAAELAGFAALEVGVRQSRVEYADRLCGKWIQKFRVADGKVKYGLYRALASACYTQLLGKTYDLYKGDAPDLLSIAIDDLDAALVQDPGRTQARVALGMVLVDTGRCREGIAHLLRAQFLLGPAVKEVQTDEEAQQNHLRERAHYRLAHAYRERGLWDLGLASIEAGATIRPNTAYKVMFGLCLAGSGQTGDAIRYAVRMPAVKIRHQNPNHSPLYRQPNDYANRWIKSQALLMTGDVAGAFHALGDLQNYKSRGMPLARRFWQDAGLIGELLRDPDTVEYYNQVPLRAFLAWVYPSAGRLLGPVVLGYPAADMPVFITPDGGFEGGSPFAYIVHQMNLMVRSPASAEATLANDRALEMCESLLRRGIQADLIQAFRAQVYMTAGRSDLARPDLVFSHAEFTSRGVVDSATSILLGQLMLQSGQNERAEELFVEALAKVPENALAWRQLGVALGRAQQFDLAQKAMNRAAELEPDSLEGWFNLGVLAYRHREYTTALGHLETAWQLEPGNTRVQIMLQTVATAQRLATRLD